MLDSGHLLFFAAFFVAAGVVGWLGFGWAKESAYFWRCRSEQGGHDHAPWRTRIYDLMHYRGASRAEAFRYSTRCEWVSASRALVYFAGAAAIVYLPFWVQSALARWM